MKELFVDQEYWDSAYEKSDFFVAPGCDPIRLWLERHFRPGVGSCMELGCFPGRYLAVLGELGYDLHGIDMTPRVDSDLKEWLKARGYKVGEFIKADVLTYEFKRQFDLVCSFGLIEHFGDWRRLLLRHAQLVEARGHLVISTPNFRGWIQRGFHRYFDQENYERHNIDAMVPAQWARVIQPLGFSIIECGFIGPFDIWYAQQRRNLFQKLVVKALRKSVPLWKLLPQSCAAYAPYCVLIARKERD